MFQAIPFFKFKMEISPCLPFTFYIDDVIKRALIKTDKGIVIIEGFIIILVWSYISKSLRIILLSSKANSFEIIQRLSKLSLVTSWSLINHCFWGDDGLNQVGYLDGWKSGWVPIFLAAKKRRNLISELIDEQRETTKSF